MRLSTLALALALAIGSMLPTPAHATSQVLLSQTELATESAAVIRGTIGEQKVVLPPEWKRPITQTEVRVAEVLYGKAPMTVVVEQIGGEWGGETLYVAGDAKLKPGEEVVLFLMERDGHWLLTAMEQSKYTVEATLAGPALHRDLTSGFFLRGPEGRLKAVDDLHDPEVRLEDMVKLLNEIEEGGAQ